MARNVKTETAAPPARKVGGRPAVSLFCGEDEPALKKALNACIQQLMPEDAMNFEVIDGQAESAEGAAESVSNFREAIMTYPFFGGGKLVHWKNVNFFDETGPGRFSSVKEALEKLIPDLHFIDGATVTAVISTRAVHKGRVFGKAILNISEARYFDLPDLRNMTEDRVMDTIEARMREAGLNPGKGATERFFQATGLNTSLWAREIEKLVCYQGGDASPITRADVDRIVSGTREVVIWDFCTAVLQGNVRGALIGLSALLAQEESEVGILIMLMNQVRLAALGSTLKEERMLKLLQRGSFTSAELSPEAVSIVPKKKSGEAISMYALGRAAQDAARRPTKFWTDALEEVYLAQRKMLTGTGDKRRVLEQLVLLVSGGV